MIITWSTFPDQLLYHTYDFTAFNFMIDALEKYLVKYFPIEEKSLGKTHKWIQKGFFAQSIPIRLPTMVCMQDIGQIALGILTSYSMCGGAILRS